MVIYFLRNNWKKSLLFLLAVFTTTITYSQITVSGKIVDSSNGDPIIVAINTNTFQPGYFNVNGQLVVPCFPLRDPSDPPRTVSLRTEVSRLDGAIPGVATFSPIGGPGGVSP